ncbi:DUF1471 domain-containing protein [Klebsiella oxytoca]|uniref:YdgH/BhsA/McbA-like domain containing protein n=1 Tax=Klebsiella oxytoca TaxID=571 RepID=UPI001092B825|nr:YdgH/BhsA/McbA-like domain containing protein [Klebsiella oxytoca]TGN40773.1 DUF1471 domain-containing protein [Klebsiella oxytoca]
MNKIKALIAVLALSFTAQQVNAATQIFESSDNIKQGVVSVTGASTLDEAVSKLSEKADQQDATSFKVISVGGDNKLFAVAEIYK